MTDVRRAAKDESFEYDGPWFCGNSYVSLYYEDDHGKKAGDVEFNSGNRGNYIMHMGFEPGTIQFDGAHWNRV